MLVPLVAALALAADPRPELLELQQAGRAAEALVVTERTLAERPAEAHRLGLDYLRGHLLDLLGRPRDAVAAFGEAITHTPPLAFYSRFRLAQEQASLGHPEVAAGLIATAAAEAPSSSPLLTEALALLGRMLKRGGDCRLLDGLGMRNAGERRALLLSNALCALQAGQREYARSLLLRLLEETRKDDPARTAAERLDALGVEREQGKMPRLVGLTYHEHGDYRRAVVLLRRGWVLGTPGGNEETEARFALARAHFALANYGPAAVLFGEIAEQARQGGDPRRRARALFEQARAYDLLGQGALARTSYRQAFLADPGGEPAGAVLLAALQLALRQRDEATVGELFDLLASRWPWREQAARAALSRAVADLVQGRRDRAGRRLDQAAAWGGRDERLEVAFWRGRLAELAEDADAAVDHYLNACRADLYHPLAQAAQARLRGPGLARAAAAAGRRLAAGRRGDDLYGGWILLGDGDPTGRAARRALTQQLLEDPATAAFLRFAEMPVAEWPLWRASLTRPEEILLGLGLWQEGAPAVRSHFPPTSPALAFTGARQLAHAGQFGRSIQLAEALRQRTPSRLPLAWQPAAYRMLLFPDAYRGEIEAQARARRTDPRLLAALVREESRFDPRARTGPSARGLTQLALPVARRLANRPDLSPEDLERPEVALAVGAAHLAELSAAVDGSLPATVAAWQVGTGQARLWLAACTSSDIAEYYSQVGSEETRAYLRRVLGSWAQYHQRLGPG
jgi:soluble lytic murein transglycosylase